jgi:porin
MRLAWKTAVGLALALGSVGYGQEPNATDGDQRDDQQKEPAATTRTQEPDVLLSPFPLREYFGGDFWTRSHVTGDWDGKRTELAEKGITFDVGVTQIFQVNARGGKSTNSGFRYSGSADYILEFDTARMGLWPAGLLMLKGETQFGQSVNSKVGSVMAVNADALFPLPDEHETTLTDVVFTQFLSEKFGFALGKIDFRGGDQNVFAHDETSQFMNLAFLANPVVIPYAPYSALTAATFYRPAEWLTIGVTALDSFGTPSVSGFDTAFHSPEGTTLATEWAFTFSLSGRPGHQRFGVAYSNRDFNELDQDPRISGRLGFLTQRILQQAGLVETKTKPDDWVFYYNFDQYLYTEPDDPTQGVGVFGRYGWSDGDVNPFEAFYSIGVGGKGILPQRDQDTFGVGYYYLDLSGNLPSFAGLSSEQGIEMFYNIEVTPWLHVTPDLQYIVDPAGGAHDDAIAFGIRTQMSF